MWIWCGCDSVTRRSRRWMREAHREREWVVRVKERFSFYKAGPFQHHVRSGPGCLLWEQGRGQLFACPFFLPLSLSLTYLFSKRDAVAFSGDSFTTDDSPVKKRQRTEFKGRLGDLKRKTAVSFTRAHVGADGVEWTHFDIFLDNISYSPLVKGL